MSYMKELKKDKTKKLIGLKNRQESGQTLHELLVATSILTIAITGFSSGIIRSNQITHRASLRKAAESFIAKDLELNIKRRFYTYRCRQGPCQDAIEEQDKSLMYYERDDSSDREDFIRHCDTGDLARALLDDDENITDGEEHEISHNLSDQDILISRTVSVNRANENQAIIQYEAEKDSEVIATIKTTLVPNAVHWCN